MNFNRVLTVGFICLGLSTIVLPITIRNYIIEKDFVLISYQGGVNFWVGNNSMADGKTAMAPGNFKAVNQYQDNVMYSSKRTAEQNLGKELKPSQVSAYWYKQGLNFISKSPGKFLGLSLKKLYYSINAYEIGGSREIYSFREYSSLLSVFLWHNVIGFPFGLLFPLALGGFYLALKNWRRNFLLLGFIISSYTLLILFFVISRFRVPIIPFLILLAALAIDTIWQNRKRLNFVFMPIIIVILGLIISNTTLLDIKTQPNIRTNIAAAELYLRKNLPDSVIHYANLAVRENPQSAEPYSFLGAAYEYKQQYQKSIQAYENFIRINPNDAYVHNRLGYSYNKLGNSAKALEASLTCLRIDSTIIEAYITISHVKQSYGKNDEAFNLIQKAYSLDSNHVPLLNHYSQLLRNRQDISSAITLMERAVNLVPNHVPSRVNLANMYFQTQQANNAEREYKKVLELQPDMLKPSLSLAQLYILTNRSSEAIKILDRILVKYPGNQNALQLMEKAKSGS